MGPVDSHQCWCWTSHECLRTFKSNERSRSNLDRLGRLGNLSQNMIRSFPYSFIPCRKEIFTMTHHVTFIKLKRLFPKKTGHDPCVCVCVCFFSRLFFSPSGFNGSFRVERTILCWENEVFASFMGKFIRKLTVV